MTSRPLPLLAWWVLWATFQTGVCVFYFFLGGASARVTPPAGSADSSLWMIALGPFLLSVVIRWLLLERSSDAQRAFVLFILGIAFAEAVCFIGLFLAPTHKLELFILSAIGIFQFLPYFAIKFRP